MSARKLLADLGYGPINLDDSISMLVVDRYIESFQKLKNVNDCDELEEVLQREKRREARHYTAEMNRKVKVLCCTFTPDNEEVRLTAQSVGTGYLLASKVVQSKRKEFLKQEES